MIAAVVVTHAAPAAMLDTCLASLRSGGGVDRIVVVDNGDRPCTVACGDDVTMLRVDNLGYGAAANAGCRRARELGADTIALLNDDVVVRAGWLQPIVVALAGDRVGAAQPMLIDAGAEPERINSLGVQIGRDGAGTDVGRGGVAMPGTAEPQPLDLFTGGAVVFTAAFLDDTGGFDERWFLYYEDVDLARRGASLGWRYRLVPGSAVEHAGGVSTGSDVERTRFLQERNRLWNAFRHEPPATVLGALWLSLRRLRHAPRAVHGRALAAGLAGAPTRLLERVRSNRRQRS